MDTKILIIDDNEKTLSQMESLLAHAGYAVVSACDGAAGLGAVRQEMPDLILMDMQMPDMNGMQVAHEIRLDAGIRHIPVIGMSAYASPLLRERALRSGMAGFFEKPIDRERFVDQIRRFIPQEPRVA